MMSTMKKTGVIVWLALVTILMSTAVFAKENSAETFLHSIYGKAYIGKDAKGLDVSTRAQLHRYFVPDLAKKMDDDATAAGKRSDIGTLDGDPFVGAQDWQIGAFDIAVRDIDADHAEGTVKFSNNGTPSKIIVSLKRLKVGWRIEDIDWGAGGKLSALFHAA